MGAVALLCLSGSWAAASEFPVKDAQAAIAIAKDVCRGKADSFLQWDADLNKEGTIWSASTMPSVMSKLTRHLWVVDIPVSGPSPTKCWDSLYNLLVPKKSN